MNLFLRLMIVMLRARLAKRRLSLDGVSRLRFRLRPADLDGGDVRQDRFASFADLGIVDLLQRSGVLGVVRRNGWSPLLAARETDVFDRAAAGRFLVMETRLLGWDKRYTFFEHRMTVDGRNAAVVRSIGRVAARGEQTPLTYGVLEGLGLDAAPKPPPPAFQSALETIKTAREGG